MTAPAKNAARPLSPHVFIYRWPLAATLSITHRITGIALTAGMVMLTWWVVGASHSPGAFQLVAVVMTSWFGKIVMFGFSLALFFHLCNGIRHLFWDAGVGFEKRQTALGNMLVLAGTAALTVGSWLLAYWSELQAYL